MTPLPYLLLVSGELRAQDREWLADLEIVAVPDNLTALSGTLDQSALHGVVRRLQDLALHGDEVRRLCACRGPRPAADLALTVS